MKDLYSRFQELIKKNFFDIGQYYDLINTSELPHYYHILYICSIKNWFLVHYGDSYRLVAYL